MAATQMQIVAVLRRVSKLIAPRFALSVAVVLLLPASALAAEPSVHVTAYSKTIEGNIGTATSGVTATVRLLRGQPPTAVDTVISAGTDSSGNWTATLPAHAPGDARDIVEVSYAGTGAPSGNFQYGGSSGFCTSECPAPSLLSFLAGRISVSSSGITIDCTKAPTGAPGNGRCSGVDVSVDGVPHAASTTDGGEHYSLTFGSSVTPAESILVSATVSVSGPPASSFTLTVPAPLPGAMSNFGLPLGPPRCRGDLATQTLSCEDLVEGNYSLEESGIHSGTFGPFPVGGFGSFSQPMNPPLGLAAGDTVTLNYTGPPTGTQLTTPHPLTTLHVGTLRADILQEKSNVNGSSGSLLASTECQPDEWFYGSSSSEVCTAGGHPAMSFGNFLIQSPPSATVGLYDELSGNETVVSVGSITATAPLQGESIYSPFTAYAEAVYGGGGGGSDTTDEVALQIAPRTHTPACPDPSCTAVAGNANSAGGLTLSGLAPGRYQAAWTLTDPHADTSVLTTGFIVQAGGTGPEGKPGKEGLRGLQGETGATGPEGKQGSQGEKGATGATGPEGKQGATGANGAAGPQGPAGQVELVTCKSVSTGKGKSKKTVQKCTTRLTSSPVKLTTSGAATAVLARGTVIYATGTATRSAGQTRLLLTPRRRVVAGRYTLTLTRGHHHERETITIG